MENWNKSERLIVTITETDRLDHQSLAEKLVHAAHQHGLSGATAFRGYQSWGPAAHFHASRVLDLSNDLPVMVMIVDQAVKIDSFVTVVEGMIERAACGALMTREFIEARQILRKR